MGQTAEPVFGPETRRPAVPRAPQDPPAARGGGGAASYLGAKADGAPRFLPRRNVRHSESMSLKIDQDHSRFRNSVRGKIRQNLRRYISQGEMLGRKGKDLVSIPIPQIDIPRFT